MVQTSRKLGAATAAENIQGHIYCLPGTMMDGAVVESGEGWERRRRRRLCALLSGCYGNAERNECM